MNWIHGNFLLPVFTIFLIGQRAFNWLYIMIRVNTSYWDKALRPIKVLFKKIVFYKVHFVVAALFRTQFWSSHDWCHHASYVVEAGSGTVACPASVFGSGISERALGDKF